MLGRYFLVKNRKELLTYVNKACIMMSKTKKECCKAGGNMARPRKNRCICAYPKSMEFKPLIEYAEAVDFSFDEYETIRLIDYMGFTQEECARQMYVARSTVASIYQGARAKLADALVNGKALQIHGGDVQLCENHSVCCGKCGKENCNTCSNVACTNNPNNVK